MDFNPNCQWRIGIWTECPEEQKPLAAGFFWTGFITACIEFMVFSIVFILSLRKIERMKGKTEYWIQLIEYSVFFLASSNVILHHLFGLPGDAFGCPRWILELIFSAPFAMSYCGLVLNLQAWMKLNHFYGKKYKNQDHTKEQTFRLKEISITLIVIRLLAFFVLSITAGVNPEATEAAVRLHFILVAILLCPIVFFILFYGTRIIHILKKAAQLREEFDITVPLKRTKGMITTSIVGVFVVLVLNCYLASEVSDVSSKGAGVLILWILYYFTVKAAIISWFRFKALLAETSKPQSSSKSKLDSNTSKKFSSGPSEVNIHAEVAQNQAV